MPEIFKDQLRTITMKRLISLILLIVLLSFVLPSSASDSALVDIEKMSEQLKNVNKQITRGQFEGDDLDAWTKLTIKMKIAASLCVSENEAALIELKTLMEGLGEKVKGEDADVTKQRDDYLKKKDSLDKLLAKCNLFVVSNEAVAKEVSEAGKSYFRKKYFARSPGMIALVVAYFSNPVAILQNSGEFIFNHSGVNEFDAQDIVLSVGAVLISILIGIWLRKKLLILESRRQWQDEFSENLIRAVLTTLSRSAPYLMGSAVAALTSVASTIEVESSPFVVEFFVGLLLFFLATTVIRLLLAPDPPARMFLSFTPNIAEALARRFKVLVTLALIGYLAFYTVFSKSIDESNLMLLRNIFSLFFVANLVWTLRVVISSPRLPKLRYVSMLVILVVLASLVAEWLGYRNLAFNSRRIIILLFVVFMISIGIAKVFRDIFNAIDDGTYSWCRRIHETLGVEKGEKVAGLIWIRLLVTIVIWSSFLVILINGLDSSGGVMVYVKSYIVNGFAIGDFHIVPSRVLLALLVFGTVIILSTWIRSQLENNWLKMTTMGPGARDAMVTILGYVLFFIAIMAGLSVAGFDFGNIAIVAGALSVGIGFGLQNIVNNFVSGLILLFERPIRKGDWIVVNGTEGYVKNIRIRSTIIQTFDRSDVIVPNSELISNQVTNWMLSSNSGRIAVPIGVAYGSDVEKVRAILLAIAEENVNVAKTGSLPKPKVIFRGFGDSSLDFELRAFLYNINDRLDIISELNFAIDKAFREQNIEIPFPQRDLHMKGLPGNGMPDSFKQNNDNEKE